MALGRLWAGKVFGTNTGNLFVELNGQDSALSGKLRVNEPDSGISVFSVEATFDGKDLRLKGKPESEPEGGTLGQLSARATLSARGELHGEWATDVGTAGTFILFPHDRRPHSEVSDDRMADQLHTARYNFGAVEVDRDAIIGLAEGIQQDFKDAKVVVTVTADTEQSRFLHDFKTQTPTSGRVSMVKLFAQEPEGTGINRIAQVEFGPQVNLAMTQGGDEAWVLGMLEKLKYGVRPMERAYSTNFKKLGFGINQILVVSTLVYLPSLGTLRDRAILMAGALTITYCVNLLHNRFLPFAAIYLRSKPEGLFPRVAPSVLSWVIAATASLAAALLAAYLQGLIFPKQP